MDITDLNTQLKLLAMTRRQLEDTQKRQAALIEAVKQTPEYQAMSGVITALQMDEAQLTGVIKEMAIENYRQTNTKKLPGVMVKEIREVVCKDEMMAEKHIRQNEPQVMIVDWKAAKQYAKQLMGSVHAIPGYQYEVVLTAQIASDLTDFLPVEALNELPY